VSVFEETFLLAKVAIFDQIDLIKLKCVQSYFFLVKNYESNPTSFNLRILDMNLSQNLKKPLKFEFFAHFLKSHGKKLVSYECSQFFRQQLLSIFEFEIFPYKSSLTILI
jgi:hypothetical protein